MSRLKPLPDVINGFRVIEDLGSLINSGASRPKRYVNAECKLCFKVFKTRVDGLKNSKSCGCIKLSVIPGVINGFKIIQDLGTDEFRGKRRHLVRVECKECLNHFNDSVCNIQKPGRMCCSKTCAANSKLNNTEYLVGYNGIKFPVIEFFDVNPGTTVRPVIVLCPKCSNPFKTTMQCIKRTTQCGCLNFTSGINPRLYRIKNNMIQRCHNPKSDSWHNYGARNISVCEEWRAPTRNFFDWALSNGYSDDLSIDRIDNNGNYTPMNCKWSTPKEQAANTRTSVVNEELINLIEKDLLSGDILRKDICVKHSISGSTFQKIKNILKEC